MLYVRLVVIDEDQTVRSLYDQPVEREKWMDSQDYLYTALQGARAIRRMWSRLIRPLGIEHDELLDAAGLSGLATVVAELKGA